MPRQLVEKRFPLDLKPSLDSIWRLYGEAKAAHWDPSRDIPWAQWDGARFDAAQREAGRLVWSHRLWCAYGYLASTPALLVRFCLEHQRESDPKYFLSVRGTEEAFHVDACARLCDKLGGAVERPANPGYERLFNEATYVQALDGDVPLEAFVAAEVAFRLDLDAALLAVAAAATDDPVIRATLDYMHADRRRHADFGWLYLEARRELLSAGIRDAAEAALAEAARHEMAGLRVPALAQAGLADDIAEAYETSAQAGLGAATLDRTLAALAENVAGSRKRLAGFGIGLPTLNHRLGDF